MGADGGGDGAKELAGRAAESWSFYTAQAQTMGKQALSSTDEALKTARLQLGQLQDASSQHLDVAKVNHSHPFFQISAAPLGISVALLKVVWGWSTTTSLALIHHVD